MANLAYHNGPQPIDKFSGQILLCYGSCSECGWWCACPEGAKWPTCPSCGAPATELLPQRPHGFDSSRYDCWETEPKAFVARFMTEREALTELTGRDPCPQAVKTKSLREKAGELLRGLVASRG